MNITNRSHNTLNQIDTLGGGGLTTIRGTLDEPGKVSVGIAGQGDKPARMLQDNRFETELPLEEGTNFITIAAMDGSYNRSDHVFSVEVAARGAQSLAYDTNGNLESDGIRNYEWDSLSRLKKITWAPGKTTDFKYNALGQRCERIETDGSLISRRFHLYDGIRQIDMRVGSSAITAGVMRRYFAQGEQRGGGTSWTNYHYCRDHLDSIREVIQSDGTLVARYDFDPYGRRLTQYQDTIYSAGCDLGYTGHITIPSLVPGQTETVLTHFRPYDPDLGRWLSADPIGEEGGMNIYAYCYGNPLNLHDPDGMLPSAAWWGGFFDVDANEAMDNLAVGAMATIDGAIPFADPFQDSGGYDPCQDGVGFSKAAGGFARDVGLAAATGGAAFARGGASRVIAGQTNSGIYQFGTNAGQYVGQSGNIANRLGQHGSRVSGGVRQWAVRGGRTMREIAEQARINSLGGVRNLANRVNPMGPARSHLSNGYITADAAAAHGGAGGALIHGLNAANSSDCQ